jgi:hypothetical protein
MKPTVKKLKDIRGKAHRWVPRTHRCHRDARLDPSGSGREV